MSGSKPTPATKTDNKDTPALQRPRVTSFDPNMFRRKRVLIDSEEAATEKSIAAAEQTAQNLGLTPRSRHLSIEERNAKYNAQHPDIDSSDEGLPKFTNGEAHTKLPDPVSLGELKSPVLPGKPPIKKLRNFTLEELGGLSKYLGSGKIPDGMEELLRSGKARDHATRASSRANGVTEQKR